VHYKEWLALVVSEGHRIGVKNSAATFLTQVARESTAERVGRRTGLYKAGLRRVVAPTCEPWRSAVLGETWLNGV
jgi:hypothetical protein